ncbi:B12-binding domain-containing protein [Magnetospirillum sp. SS-4]|uniref:cobalamin B12-binding domain-containing protein n=1 Tax=Magnetospirillum sp. SS-4 TaxID=2681465 RepID=UPI0013826BB8|nr:cobalamin-dependent protein [Magnetospirillum sp. SS-4]CAA7612801.1 Cobalamin B12-binding domain protein [Magnetospirillum sp. SS-4]
MTIALTGSDRSDLAAEVVARRYAHEPDLAERHGASDRARYQDDIRQTLLFLREAVDNESYALFSAYVAWLKVVSVGRAVDMAEVSGALETLMEVLGEKLPGPESRRVRAMLRRAIGDLDHFPAEPPGFILADNPLADMARAYLDALLAGDRRTASRLVLDRVAAGLPVRQVYLDVFQPALRETGRLWQLNRITVAHEHFVTAATQAIMSQLYPYVFTGESRGRSMVASCVSGDLHEVGLRMVADFFEMAGWDSHYLGANVPPADVVGTLKERKASVLGLSVTIAAHLGQAAELIAMARDALGGDLIILVGGFPFNTDPLLWRRLGADGMADRADRAVDAVAAIEAER